MWFIIFLILILKFFPISRKNGTHLISKDDAWNQTKQKKNINHGQQQLQTCNWSFETLLHHIKFWALKTLQVMESVATKNK
jgi:hypothetical protein